MLERDWYWFSVTPSSSYSPRTQRFKFAYLLAYLFWVWTGLSKYPLCLIWAPRYVWATNVINVYPNTTLSWQDVSVNNLGGLVHPKLVVSANYSMAFVISIYLILYHVAFTLNMTEKLDTKIFPLNLTPASRPSLWDVFKTPALLYYVPCVLAEVCTHALCPMCRLFWSFSLRVLVTRVPCAKLFVVGNRGTGLCPLLLRFCTFLLALAWTVSTYPCSRHTRCWNTATGLWLGQNLRPKEMDWETSTIRVSKRMGTVQKHSPLWWRP